MSRHIIKKYHMAIHIGWDKPLQHFYCQIYDLRVEDGSEEWLEGNDMIYSELDDRQYQDMIYGENQKDRLDMQMSFLCYRIRSYIKCELPDEMVQALFEDAKENRVNQPERYWQFKDDVN